MTAEVRTTARSWWWNLLLKLALSVAELAVAFGLVFAIFTGAMVGGCRVLYPACDSTGGLVIVVAALGVGIPLGCAYWVAALRLGLAGRRRMRYGLDAVVAAIAVGNVAVLYWHEYREAVEYRAAAAAAALSEAADREAWIAALRQNPDGHGPPGVVPPMLQVVDAGNEVAVTNTTPEWLTVALARVYPDGAGGWRACPLLTVGENAAYYRFSIGPGRTARYAPLPECGRAFDGDLLEYRVGDPVRDATGWWSDSAFAEPRGRLP